MPVSSAGGGVLRGGNRGIREHLVEDNFLHLCLDNSWSSSRSYASEPSPQPVEGQPGESEQSELVAGWWCSCKVGPRLLLPLALLASP